MGHFVLYSFEKIFFHTSRQRRRRQRRPKHDKARPKHGKTRPKHGKTRQNTAKHDQTRQNMTKHGKTRHNTTKHNKKYFKTKKTLRPGGPEQHRCTSNCASSRLIFLASLLPEQLFCYKPATWPFSCVAMWPCGYAAVQLYSYAAM